MSKKKEFLEVEFLNSNIPDFLGNVSCRDYEDHSKGFLDLGWPRNKKERKRYIKRIFYEANINNRFHSFDNVLVDNVDDGKNRNYLDLTIHCDDFGKPRTLDEAILCSFRYWFEDISEYYNNDGDDFYD